MLVALSLSACQPVTRGATGTERTCGSPWKSLSKALVRLAVGLAIGPDDNLYTSARNGSACALYSIQRPVKFIKRYGPEEGIDIPGGPGLRPRRLTLCRSVSGFDGGCHPAFGAGRNGDGHAAAAHYLAGHDHRGWTALCRLLIENDMIVELDPDLQTPLCAHWSAMASSSTCARAGWDDLYDQAGSMVRSYASTRTHRKRVETLRPDHVAVQPGL